MLRFGPSGNSAIFYAEGHKSSLQMPAWLKAKKLNAYEYSLTRGVRLGRETAEKLGAEARANEISLSVHAPYFINLASPNPENITKSEKYIEDSVEAAAYMGAQRVVFHTGSPGKAERKEAFDRAYRNLYAVVEKHREKYSEIFLCPETMGKKNQIGNLDEILKLCMIDECLMPTIDFGHLHASGGGALNSKDDFRRIFERILEVLGEERGRKLHMHYSRIEYTEKGGEKKHWTYADKEYGPEFEPLVQCLSEYKISGTVITETAGTMAEDAVILMGIYNAIMDDL